MHFHFIWDRYRCRLYTSMGCRARVTVAEEGRYDVIGDHNHLADRVCFEDYAFLAECKRRSGAENSSYRQIYNLVANR